MMLFFRRSKTKGKIRLYLRVAAIGSSSDTISLLFITLIALTAFLNNIGVNGWTATVVPSRTRRTVRRLNFATATAAAADDDDGKERSSAVPTSSERRKRRVVIVGAGWAGLSAAHTLLMSSSGSNKTLPLEVTIVDAAPRVGGLVRDGYASDKQGKKAEAGQHGFWNNYHNIFDLLSDKTEGCFGSIDDILTECAPQGQYSPRGLEAVWPVYRDSEPSLPTGLAQLVHTRFLRLSVFDRISALPLVAAFSELLYCLGSDSGSDDDDRSSIIEKYDDVSFYDLCRGLGVSERCYYEAFEPMILTGLFAPGRECSASAAMGMAYFFVLQSQSAFDVRWCKGNVGDVVFSPWLESMQRKGLRLESSTRVTDIVIDGENDTIRQLRCIKTPTATSADEETIVLEADDVILAVGATALQQFVRFCPSLAAYPEFRRFANLRGTSVLATRLYLDKNVTETRPNYNHYSANACWGFDRDVGMTFFDIRALHGENASTVQNCPGSVFEVDYYYSNQLLVMSDDDLSAKVKADLDNLLGTKCEQAQVVDAAIVRLPNAVNWYFPGSYKHMPDLKAKSVPNLYFAGDIVRSPHGSWSQEKAYVTGRQAANLLLGRSRDDGVIPVGADELHVKLGKDLVGLTKTVFGGGDPKAAPSLADFLW